MSGDFRIWSEQQWEKFRAGRTIERASEPQFLKEAEAELALRAVAFKGTPEIYALFVSFAGQGRGASVWLSTNDYALFEKYEPVVTSLMESIDQPGSPSSSSGRPAQGQAIPVPDMPDRLPAALTLGSDLDVEADRLAKIIVEGGPQSLAALHAAARAAGFGIRDADRKELSKSAFEANGVFVTESDLIFAWAMEKMNWGLPWSGFSDMNVSAAKILGIKSSIDQALLADLAAARASSVKGRRFYARFLESLGKHRRGATFVTVPATDLVVSPVQYLFVSRVMFGMGQRKIKEAWKAAAAKETSGLLLPTPIISPFRQQATPQLEGYEQDVVAWGLQQVNTILVEAMKESGIAEAGLEKYSKAFASISGLASIFKFFATYLCLEAKFELVDSPPLVRTASHFEDGERKTLKCTIVSNPDRAIRMLKDYRFLFAAFGLDSDMPSAGPLSDVETAWSLPDQPMAPSKQFVRFVGSDILRIRTNASGTAECDVTGVKQQKQIDTKKATRVMRSARVWVTPQVKPPSMQQDLTDASLNALGIFQALGGVSFTKLPSQWSVDGIGKGEAVGFIGAFLTPIMETFYRGKWLMPLGYRLPVRDWGYAGLVGTVKVTVLGSGSETVKDTTALWSFDREITIDDIVLIRRTEPVPTDPAALAAKGEAAYTQSYTEEASRAFVWRVNDAFGRTWKGVADCLSEKLVTMSSVQTMVYPAEGVSETPDPDWVNTRLSIDVRTGKYEIITKARISFRGLLTDRFTENGVVKRDTKGPSGGATDDKLNTYGFNDMGKLRGTAVIRDLELPDGAEISGSTTYDAKYQTPGGKQVIIPITYTWSFVNYTGGFEEQQAAAQRARFLVAMHSLSARLARPVTLVGQDGITTEDPASCTPIKVLIGSVSKTK